MKSSEQLLADAHSLIADSKLWLAAYHSRKLRKRKVTLAQLVRERNAIARQSDVRFKLHTEGYLTR